MAIFKKGFSKRAKVLRENKAMRPYFPILDELELIAHKHNDKLPTAFEIAINGFSIKQVKYVLDNLYPEYNYNCLSYSRGQRIVCSRS